MQEKVPRHVPNHPLQTAPNGFDENVLGQCTANRAQIDFRDLILPYDLDVRGLAGGGFLCFRR